MIAIKASPLHASRTIRAAEARIPAAVDFTVQAMRRDTGLWEVVSYCATGPIARDRFEVAMTERPKGTPLRIRERNQWGTWDSIHNNHAKGST